jgi:hypothetical protein
MQHLLTSMASLCFTSAGKEPDESWWLESREEGQSKIECQRQEEMILATDKT